MPDVYIDSPNHPDLPLMPLYSDNNPLAGDIHYDAKTNLAFKTPGAVFLHPLRELLDKNIHSFAVVCWAWVNGDPVSPIGLMMRQAHRVVFIRCQSSLEITSITKRFNIHPIPKTILDLRNYLNHEAPVPSATLDNVYPAHWVHSKHHAKDQGRICQILSYAYFRTNPTPEELYTLAAGIHH